MNSLCECGKELVKRGRRGPAPKLCPDCARDKYGYQLTQIDVTQRCRVCGAEFHRFHMQQFCSDRCRIQARRIPKLRITKKG